MSPGSCGDGTNIVLTVLDNQRAELSGSVPFHLADAQSVIRNRLSAHAWKILFVRAGPGEVLSLITPQVQRQIARHSLLLNELRAAVGPVAAFESRIRRLGLLVAAKPEHNHHRQAEVPGKVLPEDNLHDHEDHPDHAAQNTGRW